MDDASLDMKALGQALVARRKTRDWTTYRLAERAGLTYSYVYALEHGRGKRIGIQALFQLAQALGLGTDDLLRDAGLPVSLPLEDEVASVYRAMTDTERRAWIRMGRSLLDVRGEYEGSQSRQEHRSPVQEEPTR